MSKKFAPLPPGVWGVVATPFQGSALDICTDSLSEIVEAYQRIGATGLTVLGVFGEALSLTSEERALVLEVVCESSTLPLVVGITALATRPAIDEVRVAQAAAGERISAVMVQANSARPTVLIDHLRAIHAATGAAIMLQDYPASSGVKVPTETIIAAATACDFLVGIKAEAPPTAAAIAAITARVDVPVFGGLGGTGLLDELLAGAAGAMTGFSYPEALVACVRAWREEGYAAASAALRPYLPLINFEQQPGVALALRKECLRQRGWILDSGVRTPAAPFPEALHAAMRLHLDEAAHALAETVA
ncbi:dihydrodipicolinate synthase family protein [Mycetocola spongiae]|uniref:dihydrodipicolinate synthase family protein n=1 Tax=Mycetocola spongiae TaxID=2859226 RepID=UPI001CF3D257|nr:dihydrodipicolinate synthase family protein [Mycetocola spongiae]